MPIESTQSSQYQCLASEQYSVGLAPTRRPTALSSQLAVLLGSCTPASLPQHIILVIPVKIHTPHEDKITLTDHSGYIGRPNGKLHLKPTLPMQTIKFTSSTGGVGISHVTPQSQNPLVACMQRK